MRLQVDEEYDRQAWDAEVSALGGTVFHSYDWSRYRCHDRRGRPLFFRWLERDSDRVLAVALGIQRPPPASRAGLLGSRVAFDTSPASAGNQLDFLDDLATWARETPSTLELQLGSFDARVPWSLQEPPMPTKRCEFVLEPADEKASVKRMRKGTRSSITRARRYGVEVGRTDQIGDLRTFAALYQQTLQRLERTKGVPAPSLDVNSFADSLGVLTNASLGRLYAARLDGELIAGCFFALYGDTAYYMFNAANEAGLDKGGTPLLLLTAMTDSHAAGLQRVNLGGVSADAADPASPDHGLYKFKRGFGAEPVPCTSGKLIARPLRARAVDLALKLRRG